MSDGSDALRVLRQWLELTQAEGVAIHQANWRKVLELQSNKNNLRPLLAEAAAQARSADSQDEISGLLGRIRSQHSRNDAAMAAQRQRLALNRNAVREARTNLLRLRASYGCRDARAAWHSYS